MPLQKKRLISGIIAVIFTLMWVVILLPASAASEYIKTWDAYKESGGASATWNDVAAAMDKVLTAADEMYQEGNASGAYDAVNDAYYGYYETTGFERVAMGYIAGSRKTEVELQFSSCKSVAKNGGSEDDFFAELSNLSEMLHTDANKLDGVGDTGTSGLVKSGESSDAEPAEMQAEQAENAETAQSAEVQEDTQPVTASANAVSVGGGGGGMVTFLACFGIILREGLEAILVVGAIIAYLVKSGNTAIPF